MSFQGSCVCASRCFLSERPNLFSQDCLFGKGSTGGGCARLSPRHRSLQRKPGATGKLFTGPPPVQERIKTDCSGSARPLAHRLPAIILEVWRRLQDWPGRGFAKPAGRDRSRRRSPPPVPGRRSPAPESVRGRAGPPTFIRLLRTEVPMSDCCDRHAHLRETDPRLYALIERQIEAESIPEMIASKNYTMFSVLGPVDHSHEQVL